MNEFQQSWLASVPTKWEEPKRKPMEAWANVYATGIGYHDTKDEANRMADKSRRIECVHLVEGPKRRKSGDCWRWAR